MGSKCRKIKKKVEFGDLDVMYLFTNTDTGLKHNLESVTSV